MISDARYARVLSRRETHRSRSGAIVVALVVVILAAAYVGTEATLAALNRPALLISPQDALGYWRDGSPWILGGAAVLAVLGVICLLAAVTPGRLARHRIADERTVVLVDDDVLASAVSQSTARYAGVAGGQTRTAIGRRTADVVVTPTSGRPLDAGARAAHAEELVDTLTLQPRVRTRVRVAEHGVVGA